MRITIETEHNGGQERAYGPDVWTGKIRVELKIGEWRPWEAANESIIKQYIRAVAFFSEEQFDDVMDNHFTPRLTVLEQIEPGLWKYRIERPYDD